MSDNDIDHDDLVRRFVDERTLALLLVGSFARGDHGPFSDIDLARYVEAEEHHGDLACAIDGKERLITVKTLAVAREEYALNDPGKAVWQVPNLRSAVIIHDVDCRAARLIARAHDFSWDSLGGAPDRHVASEVADYAEEALKIAGGLANGRLGQILYGIMGMVVGLADVMAVHRRVFIISENRLFDIVLDAMDDQPVWTRAFRIAAGYNAADPHERGRAALALYGETVALVATLLDDNQRRVAEAGVSAAQGLVTAGSS